MLTDPVFTIREETANACVALSKSVFDQQWLHTLVDSKVDELSVHERFMIRIQVVHFMSRMEPEVDDKMINTKFTTTLLKLMDDKVPNIRFNSAKVILQIAPRMNQANKNKAKEVLGKSAEADDDFDAKFFSQKALEKLNGK